MLRKVLGVVGCNDADSIPASAVSMGMKRVAIWNDNDIPTAVRKFHAKEIEVFGWRWPCSDPMHAAAAAASGGDMPHFHEAGDHVTHEVWQVIASI